VSRYADVHLRSQQPLGSVADMPLRRQYQWYPCHTRRNPGGPLHDRLESARIPANRARGSRTTSQPGYFLSDNMEFQPLQVGPYPKHEPAQHGPYVPRNPHYAVSYHLKQLFQPGEISEIIFPHLNAGDYIALRSRHHILLHSLLHCTDQGCFLAGGDQGTHAGQVL
jgi:hypothetical protein